jgi:hypothetical protein
LQIGLVPAYPARLSLAVSSLVSSFIVQISYQLSLKRQYLFLITHSYQLTLGHLVVDSILGLSSPNVIDQPPPHPSLHCTLKRLSLGSKPQPVRSPLTLDQHFRLPRFIVHRGQ